MTPRQAGLADEAAALNAVCDPSQGGLQSLSKYHDEAAQLLADVIDFTPFRFLSASGLQARADSLASKIEADTGVNPLDIDSGKGWFSAEQNAFAGGKLGDLPQLSAPSFLLWTALGVIAIVVIYVKVEK